MGFVVAAFPVVVTFVVAQCELVALSEIAAGHVPVHLGLGYVPLYSVSAILWVMCRNLWRIATCLFDVVWLQD